MTALGLILLSLYALASLTYWLLTARAAAGVSGLPRLERTDPPAPARWPRVSVVVPACNEVEELESAARSLLVQDYQDLQLVFVNDRSTDATGAIIDRLAAGDPRVIALHIVELPEGWLGKVHALHAGLARTDGQLVLFTDADVHLEPTTLRKAVGHLLEHNLDHLTLFPGLRSVRFLLRTMIAAFIRQFVTAVRPWKARDGGSGACVGIGAFNLVRRAAFQAAGGFEQLRLEPADDYALGWMMKRSGARCAAASAVQHVTLHWYRTLMQAARGSEKGWATVCRFSLARTAVLAAMMLALELAPVALPAMLLSTTMWPVGIAGIAVFLAYLMSAVGLGRWSSGGVWPWLASILVAPLMAAMTLRVAWLGWRRGGVLWRGKLYPTELLRTGMKLRFP